MLKTLLLFLHSFNQLPEDSCHVISIDSLRKQALHYTEVASALKKSDDSSYYRLFSRDDLKKIILTVNTINSYRTQLRIRPDAKDSTMWVLYNHRETLSDTMLFSSFLEKYESRIYLISDALGITRKYNWDGPTDFIELKVSAPCVSRNCFITCTSRYIVPEWN